MSHKTTFDTSLNMLECHEVPRLQLRTLESSKSNPFADLPIGTAIRPSRERLRTVADGCRRKRNVRRTQLYPHTPRVKREPLLRIREKRHISRIFPHNKFCGVLVFRLAPPRVASSSSSSASSLSPTSLSHTNLPHTTLSHTNLSHTSFVTRAQLCHTHKFVTYKFVTHTTLSHTQICHTQICHTHNFVTSFCVAGVALRDILRRFTWQAWHLATSTFVLHGKRGTYGAGLGLVTRLGALRSRGPLAWQAWHFVTSSIVSRGRRGTWRHPPSFCVAGVALMGLGCVW